MHSLRLEYRGAVLGTSMLMGHAATMLSTLITGLTIAFVLGWELALVVLAIMPGMGISSGIHMKVLTGFSTANQAALRFSSSIAGESINNIRRTDFAWSIPGRVMFCVLRTVLATLRGY